MGRGVRPQSVSNSLLCPTHYVTVFISITVEKVDKKHVVWSFQERGASTRNSQEKKIWWGKTNLKKKINLMRWKKNSWDVKKNSLNVNKISWDEKKISWNENKNFWEEKKLHEMKYKFHEMKKKMIKIP